MLKSRTQALCAVVIQLTAFLMVLMPFETLYARRASSPKQPADEALYYKLAKDPNKGVTQKELADYLLQQADLDPEYRQLRQRDKMYDAVLKKKLAKQARDFIDQYRSPTADALDMPAFKNYLAENPAKSPQGMPAAPRATPSPTGYLDRLTYIPGPTGGKSILHDSSLHITKSAPVPGDSTTTPGGSDPGPAQFNWSKAANANSIFTLDAAISYNFALSDLFPQEYNTESPYLLDLFLVPSFEDHTSSNPKNQQDSLTAKLSLQVWLDPNYNYLKYDSSKSWFATQILSISPIYQRNRQTKLEAYGGEIFYTPIPRLPGIAYFQTLAFWKDRTGPPPKSSTERENRYYPGLLLLPSIGIETGYYDNQSTPLLPGSDKDYTRIAAKLHLDLYLWPQFNIATDYVHRTFLTGDDKSFDYVEISPILYLDPTKDNPADQHFAIGMSFKCGKTSPQFQNVKSISAWFGVKF